MHNWRYIIFSFCLLLTQNILAQNFVHLDWDNPRPIYEGETLIKTDLPGFSEAYYYPDNYLPYYSQQIDLGRDHSGYEYEVTIEYPEFEDLTSEYSEALRRTEAFLLSYPVANTSVSVAAKRGILDVKFLPLVYREGKYQRINSFKLSVEKKSRGKQLAATRSASESQKYASSSVLASGKWVKIRVTDTGVYKLTHAELRGMGFSNPAKVSLYGYGGYILPEDFTKPKIDDLQELPLWREDSYVLFYAYGTIRWEKKDTTHFVHTQNHYSKYAYYFLTESDSPMEFFVMNSLEENGATTVTAFPDYALEEEEIYSWHESGRKLYGSKDYKNSSSSNSNSASENYPFTLPGITNSEGKISLAFAASSGSSSTTVSLSVDGVSKGSMSITSNPIYCVANEASTNFTWKEAKKVQTNITVTHQRSAGISGRLDYIRLNFERELALYNSFTSFRMLREGKYKFMISGANQSTVVWDVADANSYKQVKGSLSNGVYTFVADTPYDNEYVVVNTQGTFNGEVKVVGEVTNQNLHALSAIDMIIITPPVSGLITQAERLAQVHRDKDGLTVEVVTSEQIYNEFSSGTPDASAYRWFMKMLYDRSTREEDDPKYLLLFGDSSYDNRMITSAWTQYNPADFLLSYVSENSFSEVNSYIIDDYYGFLDDNEGTSHTSDQVDIGIGRIPVRTATEARQVVDKLINYIENKNAGPWKNIISILGDDGTSSDSHVYTHMRQAEELATYIESTHQEFQVRRIYWDAYKMEKSSVNNTYPGVTKRLMDQFSEGMLVMNYTGHGGPRELSHESCLNINHLPQIYSPKPPLWITAACDVAPFDGTAESLGEAALLHPTGVAIGVYSTTRTVFSTYNATMNSAFIEYLFEKEDNKYQRLGDVVRKTKVHMAKKEPRVNNLHYVFLGDPAMKLSYSDHKVVIDEFNGELVEGELPLIKAGGIIDVKGRVVNEAGELAQGFNGVVYPTVLDTKEEVLTLNNQELADEPYKYIDRNKVLFNGSNIVEDGHFSFTFPVPLDINYSYEDGLVNLYAITEDNSVEAQGYFNDFLIGGTEDGALETDSLGPKITLYLNTPEFVYGGKVNETPCLIAELEDEDGINTIGNGIGHDLMAIINNSSNYTYVLNNYYESVLGDYTKGTVRYGLPELPEGKHQLLFRAWDVKNNSSTAILEFEVVKGLKPNIFDLYCTNSPAATSTTFILSHNRPETELDVKISVYDYSGRECWSHTETGVSADNYYYIDWDLTMTGGQRMSPGIYLYSASISSDGSKEVTKARKLVVLAQ